MIGTRTPIHIAVESVIGGSAQEIQHPRISRYDPYKALRRKRPKPRKAAQPHRRIVASYDCSTATTYDRSIRSIRKIRPIDSAATTVTRLGSRSLSRTNGFADRTDFYGLVERLRSGGSQAESPRKTARSGRSANPATPVKRNAAGEEDSRLGPTVCPNRHRTAYRCCPIAFVR